MNFSVFCLLLFLWGSASETSGLVILYLSLLCFFTHLLKFYSGGAVDLWSCLFLKLSPDFGLWKMLKVWHFDHNLDRLRNLA